MVSVTVVQDRCVYLNQATTRARLGCSIHPSKRQEGKGRFYPCFPSLRRRPPLGVEKTRRTREKAHEDAWQPSVKMSSLVIYFSVRRGVKVLKFHWGSNEARRIRSLLSRGLFVRRVDGPSRCVSEFTCFRMVLGYSVSRKIGVRSSSFSARTSSHLRGTPILHFINFPLVLPLMKYILIDL